MDKDEFDFFLRTGMKKPQRKSGCRGYAVETYYGTEYDCGYDTTITCDDCKYSNSGGRKNPAAKCNQ